MHSLHKGLFVILLAVAAGGALLAVDRSDSRRCRRREGGRPLAEFRWPLELLARRRQTLVLHRRNALVLSQRQQLGRVPV